MRSTLLEIVLCLSILKRNPTAKGQIYSLLAIIIFRAYRSRSRRNKALVQPLTISNESTRSTALGSPSKKLKHDFQMLKDWAQVYCGGGQLSCMNMGISVGSKTIFEYSTGRLDVKNKNNNASLHSIFRIFSLTKCITSFAAMILVERGFLNIDDALSKYVPKLKGLQVYESGDSEENIITVLPEREVTIRDLMTHRAGFAYGLWGSHPIEKLYQKKFPKGLMAYPSEEFIDILSSIPLMFQPGKHFTYSVSIDVLGYVIQQISLKQYKQDFRQFLFNEIFNKLSMIDTDFYVPDQKLHRLATLYSTSELSGFGLKEVETITFGEGILPAMISGGGGLFSTIVDYQKFMKVLMNHGTYVDEATGDKVYLLSDKYCKLMTGENQLGEHDVPAIHFDQAGYKEYAYYQGMGWNLLGWLIIDQERAFGGEHSEPGEYGWSGMGGLWFGVSHIPAKRSISDSSGNHVKYIEESIPVGIIFMSQTMPDKALPTQPQFRWAAMNCVRQYLKNSGYILER